MSSYYRTAEIAKAVRVHPNTVRLYEAWGLIQPVGRNAAGYRLFTEDHLNQMIIARTALRCEFTEGNIRTRAVEIVKTAALGDYHRAYDLAVRHEDYITMLQQRADEALDIIEAWISGTDASGEPDPPLTRSQTASLLQISADVLRSWEREGLVEVPRRKNGYRQYTPEVLTRLKVIRTLREAHYSMMALARMFRRIDTLAPEQLRSVVDTPGPQETIVSATDRWITTLRKSRNDALELAELIASQISQNT